MTWDIVERQIRKMSIDWMWIYSMKHKPNGTLDHYKIR